MEVKMFEIRDHATFIPIACFKPESEKVKERWLLHRAGFSQWTHLIQLVWFSKQETHWNPEEWGDRTMYNAHAYIEKNWNILESGVLIDVAYLLGETDTPKISEMYDIEEQ